MKKCKYCFSEIDENATICPVCKKKQKSNKNAILTIIQIILVLFVLGCLGMAGYTIYSLFKPSSDFKDFSEYKMLNVQELHKDYLDNEITAKEKYQDNYYYFSGTIYDITEFLTDKYLAIRVPYAQNPEKEIELDAYFESDDDLKTVKKNDEVTVYCKFKKRTLEELFDNVTSYSFHSCRIK